MLGIRHRFLILRSGGVLVRCVAFLLFLAGGSVPGAEVPKPVGRLVDIGGGQRLHVIQEGQGAPTVVFEAGTGDCSFIWQMVQRRAATFTATVSYDRAGYGWSDPSARPRTLRQVAFELHLLLKNSSCKPPYILVGQSYGGFVVRTFAARFPDDTAGVVLVDSMHENSRVVYGGAAHRIRSEAGAESIPPSQPPLAKARRNWGEAAPRPAALDDPGRTKEWIEKLSRWAESQTEQSNARSDELEWSSKEIARWHADREDTRVPLGKTRLFVLSAGAVSYSDTGNATAAELIDERRALQERLAGLSSDSRHTVRATAGHNIHLDDPQSVVDAVRAVVEAAREHRPLKERQ